MNNTEQIISQNIYSLFWTQLKHEPSEVHCKSYDNQLIIVIRNGLTKAEQLLILNGYIEIAKKVRDSIEEILQPQLKKIIEEAVDTKISELLFATHPEADYVSLIALMKPSSKTITSKVNPIKQQVQPQSQEHGGE
ncbi:Na-translocating system protein MpsC family protein [Mastigocoleus sp. MO_188.B34]|uniref:Na-translocating system protein MpsC family protein n=1 Tax=Mastigocoleus sp. MO_188.B34 TaxID=3036635 RepID=UPI00262053F3|nr:Na-translocating system protein MpsC family protein [Mastigocoleus sp. MO_188.B34]MDJ0694196.1 Na-translocating system protein MpsC family protein [Mastigocoleus sp. MO_188.B34]